MKRASFLLLTLLASVLFLTAGALAATKGADGYYRTGYGVRVKTVAFIDVKVYEIASYVKELPADKSKRGVIDLEADKKISFRMLRDVDAEKIRNAFKDAFSMNGYGDQGKIGKFLGAFTKELTEGKRTTITYDGAAKKVTVRVEADGTATIDGSDFMKAVWSIWLGKIDQPKLGSDLIREL
jgi:hypothetical protein